MKIERILEIAGQVAICILVLLLAVGILYFSDQLGPFLSGPGAQP